MQMAGKTSVQTEKKFMKKIINCVSYIQTSYTKHTVLDLLNVYKNCAMSKLQWTKI